MVDAAEVNEEMTEDLGYDEHYPAVRNRATSATARRLRGVLTEAGRWRSMCRGGVHLCCLTGDVAAGGEDVGGQCDK